MLYIRYNNTDPTTLVRQSNYKSSEITFNQLFQFVHLRQSRKIVSISNLKSYSWKQSFD